MIYSKGRTGFFIDNLALNLGIKFFEDPSLHLIDLT